MRHQNHYTISCVLTSDCAVKIFTLLKTSNLMSEVNKGSVKNKLVEFVPKFAVDFIDLIEQNRSNSRLFAYSVYLC